MFWPVKLRNWIEGARSCQVKSKVQIVSIPVGRLRLDARETCKQVEHACRRRRLVACLLQQAYARSLARFKSALEDAWVEYLQASVLCSLSLFDSLATCSLPNAEAAAAFSIEQMTRETTDRNSPPISISPASVLDSVLSFFISISLSLSLFHIWLGRSRRCSQTTDGLSHFLALALS